MSGQTDTQTRMTASSAALIRTLGAIAVISGLLVVLAYHLTLPAITENRRQAVERAVLKVIPGAKSRVTFAVRPDGLTPIGDSPSPETKIYAGYDEAGKLAGLALEAAGQGYQDVIRILYGYDPRAETITGMTVLQMTETPGLGDKIASDPGFQGNFKALDVKLNAQKSALEHPIKTVKHGSKTAPWEIDAISGATVSSKAVGKMLNDSAEAILPRVETHLDQLQRAAP